MRTIPIAVLALAALCPLTAQEVKPKDVREAAKAGSAAIPKLQEFLKNPSSDVRNQAVRELIDIGTARSLDPLIQATRDNDPEIQMLATDGLVNFYSPGYVKGGVAGTVRRVATSIRSKFTDTNDLVIDPFVEVRLEVISALPQRMATDGLVNFYSPGYVKGGVAGTVRRVATSIRSKFTDTNDLVIDAFVEVRPDVISALAQLVAGGASL